MRYIELIESTEQDITKTLQQDCGPFLSEIDNDVHNYRLYRGLAQKAKPIIKKQVRLNDRRPSASTKKEHEMFNNFFIKNFGAPYRNGLFVSGDAKQASDYGIVHVIMPIGNFSYVWSPAIRDMAINIHFSINGFFVPPTQKLVDQKLGDAGFRSDNLKSAIESGYEIMIRCDSYYAINERTFSDTFRD